MFFKYPTAKGDKPELIVDINSAKIDVTLRDRVIEDIIESHPEVKRLPTVVVSIAGVTRSGKSFLLNAFVEYLTYVEQVKIISILVH